MSYLIFDFGTVAQGATDYALDAAPGSYAVTGVNALLAASSLTHYTLNTDAGSYATTGFASLLVTGRMVAASPGAYSATGVAALTLADRQVGAAPGAYSATGFVSLVLVDRMAIAAPGAYATVGSVAVLNRAWSFDVAYGTYATTGANAALVKSATAQQYARPTSDIATNSWTASTGGSLYPMLDETSVDHADFIRSPDNPTTQQFEVKLSSLTDPGISTGHEISIGLEARFFDTNFDFDLVQGTTVLDSWTEAVAAADGTVIRTRSFSGAVADSITDYSDLRVRGVARA